MDDAVAIAKANPFFEDAQGTVEIRPIKQMEGIN